MGIKTKIEWCDSTVNPIMGCTGCALRRDHCYAAVLCTRYAGRKGWPKSFDEPEFFPGRLEKAIRWSDLTGKDRPDEPWLNGLPRHIFVNDLSDGFCPDVDAYGWLLPHLDAMESAPHIWLLLTKWPSRMREFFASVGGAPDNFYLGTSVENQATADERILWLLQTPAAVRFVSVEPMLGAVDLLRPYYLIAFGDEGPGEHDTFLHWLDWVICGGESGPSARPMHPDWARSLRDQCQAADTPFFLKQWGEYLGIDYTGEKIAGVPMWTRADGLSGRIGRQPEIDFGDGHGAVRIGKKRAGRLLDGQLWDQFPVSMPR